MPLISFIIPVYNAEKYLPQCLDSVLKQSVTDIEVICINDASTDSSLSVIKSYKDKDSRIELIDLNKNEGEGHARNIGLKHARGKYIRSVDSDDFIPSGSSKILLDAAEQYNSDMVRGGFWHCAEDGKRLRKGGRYPTEILINGHFKKDKALWFFDQQWTYLFTAALIRESGATYSETMSNGGDVAFMIQLAPHMKRVTLVPETVYYYRNNPSSIMRRKLGKEYFLNLFTLYKMEYEALGSIGYKEQVDSFIYYHLATILPNVVFPSIAENLQKAEAIDVLSELKVVFDKHQIEALCFESSYSWQADRIVPLISKQVVLLLANNYLEETYETISSHAQSKAKLIHLKRALKSVKNSTSWQVTAPFRKIINSLK